MAAVRLVRKESLMTFAIRQTSSTLRTRGQAAEYLNIKEQTLAAWACNGRYGLPFVRIGRRVMYRLADLDAFIARNVVGAEVPI